MNSSELTELLAAVGYPTLDALVARFNLREIGAPYKALVSPMSPARKGACRSGSRS